MDRICSGVDGDQTKRQSVLDLITSMGNSVSVKSPESMMYVWWEKRQHDDKYIVWETMMEKLLQRQRVKIHNLLHFASS